MIIRPMTLSDLAPVLQLEGREIKGPWTEQMWASELKFAGQVGFVAQHNNELIGYITARASIDEAELMRIAVHGAYKRRGIGSKLLNRMFTELTARKVAACFLEVRAGNQPALGLYAKSGFIRIGIRRNYFSHPPEDGVVMRKDIKSRAS